VNAVSRQASAILVAPAKRCRFSAVLRRVAITWGPLPVRTLERSSSKVTSRTFSGARPRAAR
jgi:hypothetical protein